MPAGDWAGWSPHERGTRSQSVRMGGRMGGCMGGRMSRRVVMVVPDLFFATRIATAAAHLGVVLDSASPAELADACRRVGPDLVIVDLHGGGDPLGAIRALRASDDLRGTRVVGFHSHVDAALREAALAAGAD